MNLLAHLFALSGASTLFRRGWAPAIGVVFLGVLTSQGATLPAGFTEAKVAEGLNPTTMTFAPDGRLFLCEKQGLLRVVKQGKMLTKPYLDITDQVDSWNERGLLAVCFDPEFSKNGWLYLYYTHNRDPKDKSHQSSNNRVSRFTIEGNTAVAGSEKVIWEIDNLSQIGWHNGGGLVFGQDGKLYVSTGENAKGPNAQDSGNLLGKLLRINKDGSIPGDNPHFKNFEGRNRAIVAMGLRNPYTITKHAENGALFLSEVGANYEQIEQYDSGAPPVAVNYGWPDIDGKLSGKESPEGYQDPLHPYDHGKDQGLALCGGDFYLPSDPGPGAFPADYRGKYFFSDYGGWIKMIDPEKPELRLDFASGIERPIDVATAPDGTLWYIERAGIPGGSDAANSASENGSLWQVSWKGGVEATVAGTLKPATMLKLADGIKLPTSADEPLPATLSATGIFTEMRELKAINSAMQYTLNSTVWADGAEIRRWVILPDGGTVGLLPTGDFKWPGGSIFVQHFDLVVDEKTMGRRKLETRILVLDGTGAFGFGASYRWRADGLDADLVPPEGTEETVSVNVSPDAQRQQTWSYPASGLCYLCHTQNSGFILGPKIHQLDHDQLRHWSISKILQKPLSEDEIWEAPQACRTDDQSASLADRVRSYLDVNCSSCHRPGGTGAGWAARLTTPLQEQGIIGGMVRNNFGVEDAKLVAPGNLEKSLLHRRMKAVGAPEQMPPVIRNLPDEKTLEVIAKWIESLQEKK